MKVALIDPKTSVKYLSSWQEVDKKYVPVYSVIADSARVAQVESTSFPVCEPFFWTQCADNVVADQWYYNTANSVITKVPDPAPYPVPVEN